MTHCTGRPAGHNGGMSTAIRHREPVLVLDMATLRFMRTGPSRRRVQVLTARNEVLAVADIQLNLETGLFDEETTAFYALDAALGGTVLRTPEDGSGPPVPHRIALYNPYTGEISLGALPDTQILASDELLPLPVEGAQSALDERGDGPTLIFRDGAVARRRAPSWERLRAAIAA